MAAPAKRSLSAGAEQGLTRQTLPAGKQATFAARPPDDAVGWRLAAGD